MRKIIVFGIYGIAFLLPLLPTIADGMLLILLLLAGIYKWRKRNEERAIESKNKMIFNLCRFFLYAYVLWSGLSTFFSTAPYFGAFNWAYMIGFSFGIYIITREFIITEEEQRRLFQVILCSGVITCIYGIYVYSGIPIVETKEWIDSTQFPLLQRRMYSTLQNPNLMGVYVLELLAITSPLALLGKRLGKPWLWWSVSILFFLCMLLTYSRGVWVSFAVMVLCWAFLMEKRLLWTFSAIPLVLFFYHGGIASRLWSMFEGGDSSVSLRYALWDSTIAMIKEAPVWGIGWGEYFIVYPDYNYFIQNSEVVIYHAHNMYLHLAATIGIPGMLFFVAWFSTCAYQAYRKGAYMRMNHVDIALGTVYQYGVTMLVMGVLLTGLTDYNLFSHQVSLITWQIVALCELKK